MRRALSLERKIQLAFIGAGLLLLGSGWFAVESARAYLAADAQADRLRDAERTLLAVELSLRGAESGQRGYLLTGQEEHLERYARAPDTIGRQITETRDLLAEQPDALQAFWKFDALVRFKLAELRHTVELERESEFDSALGLPGMRSGVPEMDAIRVQIEEIQRLLHAKVAAELSRSAQHYSRTLAGVLLTGVLVAGLSIAAYLFIAWDLREHRQLAAERASRDPLTELANRRSFEEALEVALEQARHDRSLLGLLFVDLDGFKTVNDWHGQDTGDAVLVEIGQRFRQAVRESDLLGRLGGDEFVLLVPQAKDGRELAQLAQRLLRSLGDPSRTPLSDRSIGASIGIALFPNDAADLQGLLTAADAAMDEAKRAGKNRIAFARSSIRVAA